MLKQWRFLMAITLCPLFNYISSQALSQEFVIGGLIEGLGQRPQPQEEAGGLGQSPQPPGAMGLGAELQHSAIFAIFQKSAY